MSSGNDVVYEHTQIGYVTGGGLLAGALVAYYSFLSEYGSVGAFGYAMIGGLGLGAILFSSLTVKVTRTELIFYFGPGFWTRRFPLYTIRRAEVVRNSPIAGWGIRRTFHGWLYNVSGLQALELEIEGEGQIRIGTDEPEHLKEALERTAAAE